VRLSYGLNAANVLKIIEENNYYPYGLKHNNYNMSEYVYNKTMQGTVNLVACSSCPTGYQNKFNGKSWETDLGLNIYAMDARQYDPAIGRWMVQDPVIHYNMSPYNAFDNNPVFWADPSGATVEQGLDQQGRQKFDSFGIYITPNERVDNGSGDNTSGNNFTGGGNTGQLLQGFDGITHWVDESDFESILTALDRQINTVYGKYNADNSSPDESSESVMKMINKVPLMKAFYTLFGGNFDINYSNTATGDGDGGESAITTTGNREGTGRPGILFFNSAFKTYRWLAHITYHEFGHVNDFLSGNFTKNYNLEFAKFRNRDIAADRAVSRSELYAYNWVAKNGGPGIYDDMANRNYDEYYRRVYGKNPKK
jgi:RHS repeat-associated protein